MCRWITVLSSEPVSLSDIVLAPSNSLIQLSKDASFHPEFTEMNNHVTNGDGFGIGWYHQPPKNHTKGTNTIPRSVRPMAVVVNPNQADAATTTITNNTHSKNKKGTGAAVHGTKKQQQAGAGGGGATAAVFKDTQPAWNNANLRELCHAVHSHCIVAHVRAASSFAGISQQNCHPFRAGRLLFCHNGRIDQFNVVRRRFHALLSDEAFNHVKGTTDSEIIFALLCTYLSEDPSDDTDGVSPYEQTEPFGHQRLTSALKRLLRTIELILQDAGTYDSGYSTCNFSLTDGETMVVTRFCDKSPNVPPPSLYFAFGDAQELSEELTQEEQRQPPVSGGRPNYMSQRSDSISSDDASQKTSRSSSSSSSSDSSFDSSSGSGYKEKQIDVEHFSSQPGTVYADVDVTTASFIVASCPLTPTHVWHPMPRNSIMWYTRGSLPELRILKRRPNNTRSYVFG